MERWRHILIPLLAFMLVGLFAIIAFNLNFMNPVARALENFSFADVYFQMQAENGDYKKNEVITIVDMTELRDRRHIGRFMDVVREQEPKVVGVDILFLGHHDDREGDFMVEAAASRLIDNAVFSYTLGGYEDGEFHKETHSFFTEKMEVTEGFSGFQRSLYNDIKRTVCLGRPSRGQLRPSFPLQVANYYKGSNIFETMDGDLHINFTPTRFQVVPWDSVEHYSHLLRGRLVLIGAVNNPKDQHYTPIGKMSGVELIAYSVQTLLERSDMKAVPLWLGIIITVLLVLLSELLQSLYIRWSEKLKNKWLQAILSSEACLTIVTFCWLVLVGYLGVLFIGHTGYEVNLGWALSTVAFLDVCRKFYENVLKLKNKQS